MLLFMDLIKGGKPAAKATTKPKPAKAPKGSGLPDGGEWKTIRGARVYIHDGKVIAGAEGKLSDFDTQEITAIHHARANKKDSGIAYIEGSQVKVGKERKVGTVKKLTATTVHIDYGGEIRKVPKSQVRRADAYRLKLEEKLADGGKPTILDATFIQHATPAPSKGLTAQQKAEKLDEERKTVGVTAKNDDEWADELGSNETVMSEMPFDSIKAPLLVRDAQGRPLKEIITDDMGIPITDPITGQRKERYVYRESDTATEEDILRDHQGLLIDEIVNPYARRYGLEYMQREWRDDAGNPTDLYGDLVQTANIGFLTGLREYAARTAKGDAPPVTILTHALGRSRLYTKRHAQDIFNAVPLPEKLLAPLAIVSSLETAMEQALGRKPTDEELVNGINGIQGLKGNATYNSLKMKTTPSYDHEKGAFDDGKPITDPKAKLEAVRAAKRMQKPTSLDVTTSSGNPDGDDKETTRLDTVADQNDQMSAEEARLEVEGRQRKIKQGVKKLLASVLDEREAELIIHRFGIGDRSVKGLVDLTDVAEKMNISLPLAKKISASAMKKLTAAPPAQLEALKKVYMTKSLSGFDLFMKSLYAYDLQKSLATLDMTISDLDTRITRTVVGHYDEIVKSLDIPEFIGSVTSVEGTDDVYVHVIEYIMPDDMGPTLSKAFSKKKSPVDRNNSIRQYVQAHSERYNKLAARQATEHKTRYGQGSGPVPWSVQLLLDNPGSCWITWHGDHILINGSNGGIIYDSSSPKSRERYHATEDAPEYEHQKDEDYGDEGRAAVKEDLLGFREKWKGKETPKTDKQGNIVLNRAGRPQMVTEGGFITDWRNEHRQDFALTPAAKVLKQFPSGKFLMKNPYTGKQIVVAVDLLDAGTDKARTAVTYAFDPEADERVNIGNWAEIYRHLYEEAAPKSAYEYLMNDANLDGKHKLELLADEDYDKLYKGTTEGARASMVHRNFTNVTPETMKIVERNPATGKMESKVVPYKGHTVYEADLGNGKVAVFQVTEEGKFADPVMQKLIQPNMPIRDANDLYKTLRDAIGNETWVTISPSSVSQLSHHVKLKYDGQGAPIVVGGAFDGYRFQDASEVDDPDEKARSLFKGGKPVRPGLKKTEKRANEFDVGVDVRIRNPQDRRKWVTARIIKKAERGKAWVVEISPDSGITFPNGANFTTLRESDLKHTFSKLNIATEAPIIDVATGGMLNLSVPEGMRDNFEANFGVTLDTEGRANISIKQFMDIRDGIGSFSLTLKGKSYLEDFYAKQERAGMPDIPQLLEKFNPNNMTGFRDGSFLKKTNIYNSQAEGIEHLLQAGKGVAGHGMGTGKTILGVVGAMYLRDQAIRAGKKPGKALIVSPAGIQSEWLKEINRHTTVGVVVVGSNTDHGSLFGQVSGSEDLRSRIVGFDQYKPDHDEHFVVMSYDQFMKDPQRFRKWAEEHGFDSLIIDEVHAFKTPDGNRNRQLLSVSPAFEHVWGLSGTPMDNEVTDIYHLVNAITGGKHDLGSAEEFNATYLLRSGGKVVGMNESKLEELGRKMAKFAHFRSGYHDQITYVDARTGERKTVNFPEVPAANRYHGDLRSVVDYDTTYVEQKDAKGKTVTGEDGQPLTRPVHVPKPTTPAAERMYARYRELESRFLSESQRQALEDVATSGLEHRGGQNYLQGVQKLQQFLNAPHSEEAYWEPITNSKGENVGRNYQYRVDADGHKRYYKAELDAEGNVVGTLKGPDGKPVELPPMHHNNPKADHLRRTILDQLAEHQKEMERRVQANRGLAPGQTPLPIYPPKVVITSGYTTFGAEVVENVIRDISRDLGYGYGTFTGNDEAVIRDQDKVKFQKDPNHAFMIISNAGKEGIDLGNAHMLIHYDQDFNPNLMAQKSARALRSDSWKHAEREMRPNQAKIVSIHMPGTIEDTIVRAQQRKMEQSEKVERAARKAEGAEVTNDYAKINAGSQRKWVRRKQEPPATADELKTEPRSEQKAASMKLIMRL